MGFKETYEAIPKTEYMRRFEAIYDEALLQQETPPADPSEVLFLYQEIEKLYLACEASKIEKDSGSGYYSADAANLVDNTTDIGNLFAQTRATVEGKAKIARQQLEAGQKDPKKTEAEAKAEKKSAAPWYHRKFNEFARDFETLKEKKKTLKLTDEAYLEKLEALHLAASRELGRLTLEKKMDLLAEKSLVASIKAEYPSEKAKKNYLDNKRSKLLDRADDWKDVPLIGRFFKWRLERNDKKHGIDTEDFSTDIIHPVTFREENPLSSEAASTRLATDLQSAKNNLGAQKKSGPAGQLKRKETTFSSLIDKKEKETIDFDSTPPPEKKKPWPRRK